MYVHVPLFWDDLFYLILFPRQCPRDGES